MMRWIGSAVFFLALLNGCSQRPQRAEPKAEDTGILVLAHGADKQWNQAIQNAVASVRGGYKKEIAFGMGDAKTIQRSIDKLESEGAKAIIVVPLFLSSHSEMYRHVEYVLGLREEPDILFWILMSGAEKQGNHEKHGMDSDVLARVTFQVPYKIASPINYSPLIAEIIEERLKQSRFAPDAAGVFILAHGPIGEDDNKEWVRDLQKYARRLSSKFNKAKFLGMTFRDDAPAFIKNNAVKKIQEAIKLEVNKGRKVIVIPFLLAPGGREEEIKRMLEGCGCEIMRTALLPHPNVSKWIEQQAKPR